MMTDQEFDAATARVDVLNARNQELRWEIDVRSDAIRKLSLEMQEQDIARQKAENERREVKREYGDLYEQVGVETRRRAKLAEEAAVAEPAAGE